MGQSYQSYQSSAEARAREAQDSVHALKQKAEDAAETVKTQGAKMMRDAGETAESAIDATKRFVQEQPLVAIGAVAVFACALGALWKLTPRREADLMERVSNYVEPGYRALRRRF